MVVSDETLTPNQAARRDRVLDAAMRLAAEGGYDAVQMRDVATRAQVALGTIYRYFSSKDHLLAACQLELWRDLAERFARRPPVGPTAGDRVVEFLGRAMQAAEHEPLRTAALVTASASPDPAVRDCQIELMATMDQVFADAMGDLDPAVKARAARTLRMVWFGWLVGWVNGWNDTATVNQELESATRLLLDGR
jgi:TetR/AcrR family transcriptional regulator, cholesterol catabolism regulator